MQLPTRWRRRCRSAPLLMNQLRQPSLRSDGRARAGGRRLLPLAVTERTHRGLQRGQLGVQHVESRLPALVAPVPFLPQARRLQTTMQLLMALTGRHLSSGRWALPRSSTTEEVDQGSKEHLILPAFGLRKRGGQLRSAPQARQITLMCLDLLVQPEVHLVLVVVLRLCIRKLQRAAAQITTDYILLV